MWQEKRGGLLISRLYHVGLACFALIALTACSFGVPEANPGVQPIINQSEPDPTTTKLIPTKTPNSPSLEELGIENPAIAEQFIGVEASIKREANGSYSVTGLSYRNKAEDPGFEISQTMYTIDPTSFNTHEELNNAYAPATVEANTENKTVTLIWNKEFGWVEEFTLSTDISNPTKLPYEARVLLLQSILLQHKDPFVERSEGLLIRSQRGNNGRTVYLRTDDSLGSNSKPTNFWLRVTMSDGQSFYVSPIDINDLDGRKLIMCAYGREATSDESDGFNKMVLNNTMHLEERAGVAPIFWPVLKADTLALKDMLPLSGGIDQTDLDFLLTIHGDNPFEMLGLFSNYTTHFTVPEEKNNEIESSVVHYDSSGNWTRSAIDPKIQEMFLPCEIK